MIFFINSNIIFFFFILIYLIKIPLFFFIYIFIKYKRIYFKSACIKKTINKLIILMINKNYYKNVSLINKIL
jgi:hypothetical protein